MKTQKTMLTMLTLALMAFFALTGLTANAQQAQTHDAYLHGAAINHILPHGLAQYTTQYDPETGWERQFEVEVHRVNMANGTILSVELNGQEIGRMKLWEGEGSFNLDTQLGNNVPYIQKGDKVAVVDRSGTIIVSGTF
ncbi:MAG TPA: hypothetical protein VFA07_19455 [Chthonomonadaceae bacterium]|nr:hypothetical protein [Chthonomonadaceae bacterium]